MAKPSMVVEVATVCFLADAEVGHCLNVMCVHYTNVSSGCETSMMTSNYVFDNTDYIGVMLSDGTIRSMETEFCGNNLLKALSSQTHLFIVTLEKKHTFKACGHVILQASAAVLFRLAIFLDVNCLGS